MDIVKVSLDKPIYNELVLDIDRTNIYEEDGFLYCHLNSPQKISVGDIIDFKRFVYSEETEDKTLVSFFKRNVTDLIKDDSGNTIGFIVNEIDDQAYYVVGIESAETIDDYYKITFNKGINIFGQDLVQNNNATTFYVYDDSGETMDVITDLKMPEIVSENMASSGIADALEFIFDRKLVVDYNCDGKDNRIEVTPQYYYIPNKMEENTIYGKIGGVKNPEDLLNNFVYKNCNDIYYLDDENNAILWEDQSGATLNGVSRESGFTTINDFNSIEIAKETGYWQVQIGVKNSVDYTHMYQEDKLNSIFVDDVNTKIVETAPVIDMEKVKYVPYVSGKTFNPLTSITYNLHFRVRDLEDGSWQYSGATDDTIWWNEQGCYVGEQLVPQMIVPANLQTHNESDMIGFLGFTDNDIQNQKMKVRKSFIRLLFYDSKDPMTQKLLYYSTIFFDTGELFGKYIKAKNELKLMNLPTDDVVFNSSALTDNRLDCRFTVSNEYNTEKSSDGFNVYYFPENEVKTIYMKVEFNHAGYGRTIPMMEWGWSGNSVATGLTVSDYLNQVYIPIEIGYIENEKRYYYKFTPDKFIETNENNDTISINLVEPKLTMIPKN